MLVKMTSKNQLTLPKAITSAVGAPRYFEVKAESGQIVLTPVRIQRADAVRARLAELGVAETDAADAVRWVRPRTAPDSHRPGSRRATEVFLGRLRSR
jgi:hypothetical protein